MFLSSVSPGKLVRGVTLLRFLYSVGLLFESLSLYWFFPGFLSPSRQIPGCYWNSCHWCYLSYPSQFITHHRPIIWRYITNNGAALLDGRSRDPFPVVSLDFSVTYSFRPYHGPGVDSAPSENEYQEYFLGVKATGAWGWRPHHLYVSNVMEIWKPKPAGTLWATPDLLGTPLPLPFIGSNKSELRTSVLLPTANVLSFCVWGITDLYWPRPPRWGF